MVESIYFLKPAWCGTHFAGLWPAQGPQPVTRATAWRRWFVTQGGTMACKQLFAIALLSITALTIAPQKQARASSSLDDRRDALNKLLDEQWQYTMREPPELAT